jgi:hypothetical protein
VTRSYRLTISGTNTRTGARRTFRVDRQQPGRGPDRQRPLRRVAHHQHQARCPVNVPDPDGTRQTCHCGQPTVLAEITPGQRQRVHCGTYTNACTTPTRRRTR